MSRFVQWVPRRVSLAIVAALAVVLSLFAAASPAMADTTPNGFCPGSAPGRISWSSGYFPWHSASWGRARVCNQDPASYSINVMEFLVEDTLTDGYCVHVEVRVHNPFTADGTQWIQTSGAPADGGTSTTSCGAAVYGGVAEFTYGEIIAARLIRGSGSPGVGVNYTTIWTHP